MSRIDGDLPADGAADLINAEVLFIAVGVRFCADQRPQGQRCIVLAGDWVGQLQFVAAVALFGYRAADAIPQKANAVTLRGGGAIVKFGNHVGFNSFQAAYSVHQLGVSLTPDIPPFQEISVFPAGSTGNCAAVTYRFRFLVPA